jgi:hypothetical protein
LLLAFLALDRAEQASGSFGLVLASIQLALGGWGGGSGEGGGKEGVGI